MVNIPPRSRATARPALTPGQSPVPAVGDNLFTFMANRLSMSFDNLSCGSYGLKNPVTVTLDGSGAITGRDPGYHPADREPQPAAGLAPPDGPP